MSNLVPSINPPQHYLVMVGYCCTWWQHVELTVESAIWRWSGLSQRRGRCFTANMSFPLRCDVLMALAANKFGNPTFEISLRKLIEKEVKAAQGVRNRYAHALWFWDDDDKQWLIEKPSRTRAEIETAPAEYGEMVSGASKILSAWELLLRLIDSIESGQFAPETWRGKSVPSDSLYDEIAAARAQHRAMKRKRRNPPPPSRA